MIVYWDDGKIEEKYGRMAVLIYDGSPGRQARRRLADLLMANADIGRIRLAPLTSAVASVGTLHASSRGTGSD